MSRTYSGTRILTAVGVVAAAVLVLGSAAFNRFWALFTIEDGPTRADHLDAAVGFAVAAVAVVALAVVVRLTLDVPTWAYAVLGALLVVAAGVAVHDVVAAGAAEEQDAFDVTIPLRAMLLVPASWPLLVYLVVAPVRSLRARPSHGPRPRPGRSSAPAPPRSA